MMSPRALAFHILLHIRQKNIHPDSILRSTFQRHPRLSLEDKALTTELVYGVLRWQARLDWYIEQLSKTPLRKINPQVLILLRIGTYQLTFLTKIPDHAAVDEVVKIARATQPKYIVSFVNGILRNVARTHPNWNWNTIENDPIKYLSILTSHPKWFIERLMSSMKMEEVKKICEFNNTVAPMTFRVNQLKTDINSVEDWFKKNGYETYRGTFINESICINKLRQDLSSMEIFKKGWIQVQDEASMLVCYLLSPQPGERLLDLCCGYGIKTTQLAQIMKNHGNIVAVDNASWKLEALEQNAARLGVNIIKTVTSDVRSLDKEELGTFDRVLLDAPCTGWGTIRRNPDIKWKTHPRDPWRMSKLQKDLLNHAAQFVKPGGTLTYATCSIFNEENSEVAEQFETTWKWKLIDASKLLPNTAKILVSNGYYQTWPHRDGIDGFFGATWQKPK